MSNFNELRNAVVGGRPELVAEWNKGVDKMESDNEKWISELREKGFKAAHPNDGWVNREKNIIHLAYPQFNDGLRVGDKLMLGWASDKKNERPVKIIDTSQSMMRMVYYHFEDL